jgi:hypothetical protein
LIVPSNPVSHSGQKPAAKKEQGQKEPISNLDESPNAKPKTRPGITATRMIKENFMTRASNPSQRASQTNAGATDSPKRPSYPHSQLSKSKTGQAETRPEKPRIFQ